MYKYDHIIKKLKEQNSFDLPDKNKLKKVIRLKNRNSFKNENLKKSKFDKAV